MRCPIHGGNTAHSLRECHKFRKRPYKEKVDYLFKHGYCLGCCGGAFDSSTSCTEVCNVPQNTSKSCAKISLIKVYSEGQPYRARHVYCVIDDQSNQSLASSFFFDAFGESGPETEYVLSTCTGRSVTTGRKASGYIAQSLDGSYTHKLLCLIECNEISNNRDEIPSKSVARHYSHLADIQDYIPEIDTGANIDILIGRDLTTAHHMLDQRVGQDGLPFGQKLPFGWVVVGNVCLGKVHQPEIVSVMKTSVLTDERASYLIPCDSEFSVKEGYPDIFQRSPGDEKLGLSIQDKKFMESGFKRSTDGFWEAPLPFKDCRQPLPNNHSMALRRAMSFDRSLRSNPIKCKQVVDFMDKLLVNHHAELAPKLPAVSERWYLPMFAVHHPKKPERVRVVFDSSAKYKDSSLNSVLLQGSDILNNLFGILLRFRKEKVAATMDVEHMFYNFKVPEKQRCYLRFFWHQNNDIDQPLIEYQMNRHVFGNSTSPSIANYGFRKIVEGADKDVQDLINENFYVDDGLVSCKTVDQTVDLVLQAQQTLQDRGRVRLHKFPSNSRYVLNALDQADLAKNLKDLDLGTAALPTQRSLRLLWNTESDSFIFSVNQVEKP
ncbi:uncharacterized protein LOC125665314 [Ostrea edulis]|uniref:uncharacterized protein LOC125665314 n=1 Tax=Ostrea edulis TaxID=37623 RepID=UPI0024AF7527|nr:uncharacterized protein LOC125665314 [Ostrea edulis]